MLAMSSLSLLLARFSLSLSRVGSSRLGVSPARDRQRARDRGVQQQLRARALAPTLFLERERDRLLTRRRKSTSLLERRAKETVFSTESHSSSLSLSLSLSFGRERQGVLARRSIERLSTERGTRKSMPHLRTRFETRVFRAQAR